MVDNREWLTRYGLLDYLRDIGKHFTISTMLEKDSVQQRLGSGLSFTEFSYQTLQATDFLHLYRDRGVEMQMGGADQWGNITAGISLIRRVTGSAAHGLSQPLLLTSDGRKMGKTEAGSVMLDATLTSPYAFYQYWLERGRLRTCAALLTRLTLMPRDQIDGIARGAGGRPRAATRPAGVRLRPDGPHPRTRGGGPPGACRGRGVLQRARHGPRGARRAVPGGGRVCLGRGGERRGQRSPWTAACSAPRVRRGAPSPRAACPSTASGSHRWTTRCRTPVGGRYHLLRQGRKRLVVVRRDG